jgi:diguanylate cyclase (GGDEF)-like protein
MKDIFFSQIIDTINIGFVVLDQDLRVQYWNRWMAIYSAKSAESVVGSSIFDFYPHLNNPRFIRNCKSVFAFGHYSFLSQKLHRYLFPFKYPASINVSFEYMLQSCSIFPLRDSDAKITNICITVQDVTEIVTYENKLITMSKTDSLTGVCNRRYLEERMKEEFARHKRHQRPLSLMVFDLDFFKQINDTSGHQCGDFILMSVVSTVRASLREVDILARYGGDEFCCVLPDTPLSAAFRLAERIRGDVMKQEYRFGDKVIPVTVSIGLSAVDESIESTDSLFKNADDALYEAKRTGRNKAFSIPPMVHPLNCIDT